MQREEQLADSLLRLASGKIVSSVLEIALEHDVISKLKGEPTPLSDLAPRLGLPASSARAIVQCLTYLELLTYQDGKVVAPPHIADLLGTRNRLTRSLRQIFSFRFSHDDLREFVVDPPVLHWYQLLSGGIQDERTLLGNSIRDGAEWLKQLSLSNHAERIAWGEQLATEYDFSRHRVLLDLGGSTGGWCIGIRRRYSHLRCIVFDTPEVCRIAREKIAEAGEESQIEVVEGSFFSDDPPVADAILLANILHDWTMEDDRRILRTAHRALQPGGRLLVQEIYFEDDWRGSIQPVLQAFLVLGQDGQSGWQPSYREVEDLLRDEGFQVLRRAPRLVISEKPLTESSSN